MVAKTLNDKDTFSPFSPLYAQLADHFGRHVDIIHLRKVDTVFQYTIITTGTCIATLDKTAAQEFEMHTMSLYQKFCEERKDILEAGLARGRFYDV